MMLDGDAGTIPYPFNCIYTVELESSETFETDPLILLLHRMGASAWGSLKNSSYYLSPSYINPVVSVLGHYISFYWNFLLYYNGYCECGLDVSAAFIKEQTVTTSSPRPGFYLLYLPGIQLKSLTICRVVIFSWLKPRKNHIGSISKDPKNTFFPDYFSLE